MPKLMLGRGQLLELRSGGRVDRHLRYQIIDVRLSSGVLINRRPCSGVGKQEHFRSQVDRALQCAFDQIPLYCTSADNTSHFWVDGEKFLGRVGGGAVKGGEGCWQGRTTALHKHNSRRRLIVYLRQCSSRPVASLPFSPVLS